MTDTDRTYTIRSADEIVERYRAIKDNDNDVLGWRAQVLLGYLPFHQVSEFLPTLTAEQWNENALDVATVHSEAVSYLRFAFVKAIDHRGISAGRSVDKMTEYCWLLGAPSDLLDQADYAMYGAPMLKVAAEFLGVAWPDDPALNAMADGRPCEAGCEAGCGR